MSLALNTACIGGRRAGMSPGVLPPSGFAVWNLTPRQVQCIDALIKHGSAKKAAASLGLSPRTVDNHIGHAYEKVGVSHIAQLVAAYVTAQLKGQ